MIHMPGTCTQYKLAIVRIKYYYSPVGYIDLFFFLGEGLEKTVKMFIGSEKNDL